MISSIAVMPDCYDEELLYEPPQSCRWQDYGNKCVEGERVQRKQIFQAALDSWSIT